MVDAATGIPFLVAVGRPTTALQAHTSYPEHVVFPLGRATLSGVEVNVPANPFHVLNQVRKLAELKPAQTSDSQLAIVVMSQIVELVCPCLDASSSRSFP